MTAHTEKSIKKEIPLTPSDIVDRWANILDAEGGIIDTFSIQRIVGEFHQWGVALGVGVAEIPTLTVDRFKGLLRTALTKKLNEMLVDVDVAQQQGVKEKLESTFAHYKV